jgi:DNA-binding LytR/AlgR family response regulator
MRAARSTACPQSHRLVKVLVVDDEKLARDRLVRMLERVPDVVCVGQAANGAEALERIAALRPDLVLLDVEMPGVDGLEVAEAPGAPPIIFTTAHVRFATAAFDLDAVDYLTKPVRQDRLERAIDRARRRASAGSRPVDRLAVHGAGGVRFVDLSRVNAFRALDKYTEFTLDGESLLVRESLDALAARLGDAAFVRVHRAALVRREAIVGLTTEGGAVLVRLADGSKVLVSRRQAPSLRRLLGLRQS